MKPPVTFASQVKAGAKSGPPIQIRATDLDRCFAAAMAEFHSEDFTEETCVGDAGYPTRRVKLAKPLPPYPPKNGRLYVLGCMDEGLLWVEVIDVP